MDNREDTASSVLKKAEIFKIFLQTQIYGPGLGKCGVVSPFSHISSRGSAYLRPGTILPNFAFSYSV